MKNHSFLKYCTSILLIFIAVACTTGNKEQKIVTVTIQPQKYFAEKIAGDRFNINCIVPPGSNPEAYDPSPSHLVHLGKSIAYFKIGHIGFELAWMDKLEQNNPNMKIFDTSEGIDILSGTHEHNDADVHHHHFDADPHTWSSPKNVRIIARNMYVAFVSIDPDRKSISQELRRTARRNKSSRFRHDRTALTGQRDYVRHISSVSQLFGQRLQPASAQFGIQRKRTVCFLFEKSHRHSTRKQREGYIYPTRIRCQTSRIIRI